MADRIEVDCDIKLSGGSVKLRIETGVILADVHKAFVCSVMDKVTEFVRAIAPDAPVPELAKPKPEVVGRFGPVRAGDHG